MFSIIYMIRIRFFWAQRIKSELFVWRTVWISRNFVIRSTRWRVMYHRSACGAARACRQEPSVRDKRPCACDRNEICESRKWLTKSRVRCCHIVATSAMHRGLPVQVDDDVGVPERTRLRVNVVERCDPKARPCPRRTGDTMTMRQAHVTIRQWRW